MSKLLYEFKRRRKDRLVLLLLAVAAFTMNVNQEYPCHIVRTYEIDGIEYADYVVGDDSFHQVYIEDVPNYVVEGRK